MFRPLERFAKVEASSAIVLSASALAALAWANSPWSGSYHALWETPITFGVGTWVSIQSLRFWVDDGLMAIFFLVVGLEIRRELHHGELSDKRRAALPAIAAVGGMIAPALLYLAINREGLARHGWGIPTATDIAFAVGVLGLLGKRAPPALRSFLLALAIIDDIGAIVLIAIFYSGMLHGEGLLILGAGLLLVWLLQRAGVRRAVVYLAPGAIVWWGLHETGVHPAMAGVVLGFATPVTRAPGEALAPAVRLEDSLHPWVAYGVMPIFALANAGVTVIGFTRQDAQLAGIMNGILFGLVVGKPLGILAASFAAVKLRVAALPRTFTWSTVFTGGCIAGIGFTVAIFIVGLAFQQQETAQAAAKLAVLAASAVAAAIGLFAGRVLLPMPTSGERLASSEGTAGAARERS